MNKKDNQLIVLLDILDKIFRYIFGRCNNPDCRTISHKINQDYCKENKMLSINYTEEGKPDLGHLTQLICEKEGGLEEVNIAQVKDVLRALMDIFQDVPPLTALDICIRLTEDRIPFLSQYQSVLRGLPMIISDLRETALKLETLIGDEIINQTKESNE